MRATDNRSCIIESSDNSCCTEHVQSKDGKQQRFDKSQFDEINVFPNQCNIELKCPNDSQVTAFKNAISNF